MRTFALLILITFLNSCNKNNSQDQKEYKKINFNLSIDFNAEFAKMIIPNKNYSDWQYVQFDEQYGVTNNGRITIIKQVGDSLKFPRIDMTKVSQGFFQGGHPGYSCNYIAFLNKEKIKYVRNEEQFRDFLGKIDNLEEAILLAKTFGYYLDDNISGSAYRIINDSTYQLHLAKFSNYPNYQAEQIEITITKDGYFKSKNLGIYCSGVKCVQ